MKMLLLFVIILASCSKQKKENCWKCHVEQCFARAARDTIICTPDGREPIKVTDGNGNDCNYSCRQ